MADMPTRADFEVEDALRTLISAMKIKKDKKLMAKVKALAKTKINAIETIAESDDDESDDKGEAE